jgi:hypothetical protein
MRRHRFSAEPISRIWPEAEALGNVRDVCRQQNEGVSLATEREENPVEVLLVARSGAPPPELVGVLLAKLLAPLAEGRVGHEHATDEQEFLPSAVAEAEAEIEPTRGTDALDWAAVVLLAVERCCICAPRLAHQPRARQAAQQVDKAPSLYPPRLTDPSVPNCFPGRGSAA